MYLWFPAGPLISPVVVLAATLGLYGHEDDLVSEGTAGGFSDESDLTSLVEGPGRELCPGGNFTLDRDVG